jgi:hypothetical protein
MLSIWYEAEQKVNQEWTDIDSDEKRKLIEDAVKEKISKLTEQLVDATNIMGMMDIVVEGILLGLTRSHRYLQSEFWQAMSEVIIKYGNSENFDARNEWAVQMCKRMGKVRFPN